MKCYENRDTLKTERKNEQSGTVYGLPAGGLGKWEHAQSCLSTTRWLKAFGTPQYYR